MPFTMALAGQFELKRPDGSVARLGLRARALLAYVALEPAGYHARRDLAALLWPRREPVNALASLRQCLREIRSECGDTPLLEGDARQIRLCQGSVELDIDTLSPKSLMALHNGWLADVDIAGRFSTWLHEIRLMLSRRLERIFTEALDCLVAGDDTEAVRSLAESCLRHFPNHPRALEIVGARPAPPPPAPLAPAVAASAPRDALPVEAPPLVVVGTFAAEPGLPDHLEDAIRDEMMSMLARFSELRLVADARPIEEIARNPTLAGWVVEANLRHGIERPVLHVRLITLPDRAVHWAQRRKVDPATMEGELGMFVSQIADAVLPDQSDDPVRLQAASGTVFARYITARISALWPADHNEALRAAEAFDALIAEAPRFAPPYRALAQLLNTEYAYTRARSTGPVERERAFSLAQSALVLDRHSASSWIQMAWCLLRRGDWTPARRHIEQAIELNPHDPARLNSASSGMLHLGDMEACETLLERSRALMLVPDGNYWADRGLLDLVQGDFDAALDSFASCARPLPVVHVYATAAAALAGRRDVTDWHTAAVGRLAPIFNGPDGVVADALVDWLNVLHPFRMARHRDLMHEGVRLAFARPRPQ